MGDDLLTVCASGGQGFAATVGSRVPAVQQDQIERSLRCAQLRTNDAVDWTTDPQRWMDSFIKVYSSASGWGNWTITGLRLPDPLPGERLLQRLTRALRSDLTRNENQAVQRAIAELERLIKAGDPVAKPFHAAERTDEKTAISIGSADLRSEQIILTCGFAHINISQKVKDFLIGERVTTRASIQCATLSGRWVQANFDMFEPKINEYLAAKRSQLFTKVRI